MKSIYVYRAQGIGGQKIESSAIVLKEEMPKFENHEIVEKSIEIFDRQSDEIIKVLDTLPGGTLDRLIGKLLMKKATALVVPLFGEKEKNP